VHARKNAIAVIGVVVVAAASLGGCSLLRGGGGDLPAPTRSISASPTPTPSTSADAGGSAADLLRESSSPRPPTPEPSQASAPAPTISTIQAGTVVTEGDVASPKGSVHFHYRVVAGADGHFVVQYSGFTSTLPVPVSATFLEDPPAVGDGLTYHGIGDDQLGGATTTPSAAVSVPIDEAGSDPSWLGSLVTYSSATADPSLPVEIGPDKVLAVTKVAWSVPARTTNVHPADGGATANASGTVSATTASGAPASYVIAPGDLIGDVAARFGITVEALIWLNDGMQVYGQQQYLYEGTTLNLDPLRR
jgi:LysM repeat protein